MDEQRRLRTLGQELLRAWTRVREPAGPPPKRLASTWAREPGTVRPGSPRGLRYVFVPD